MAKKKSSAAPTTFAYEEFMVRARKEGRVRNEELSMKVLTLDYDSLQARENRLDLGNVRSLHQFVKDGATLSPITVFEVDGKLFVADGFHRCEVHKREKLPSIRAVVVTGTMQEAVEYATSCNLANHSLDPTPEDKKKAVMMLLGNGWLDKTYKEIGDHAGVSMSAAKKYVLEYCENTGAVEPEAKMTRNGRMRTRYKPETVRPYTVRRKDGRTESYFGGTANGKEFRGATKEASQMKIDDAVADRKAAISRLIRLSTALFAARVYCVQNSISRTLSPRGVSAAGYAVTSMTEERTHVSQFAAAIHAAVGRAVILAEHFGVAKKVILVPEPMEGYEELIDIARRLGVEFMTLDEFIAVAKASEAA